MTPFCNILKETRQRRNMTRKELASLAGVSTAAISFYESGTNEPSASVLLKLAKALHISMTELLGGDGAELLPFDRLRRELESLGYQVKNEGNSVQVLFHDPEKRKAENDDEPARFKSIDAFCKILQGTLDREQEAEKKHRALALYNILCSIRMLWEDSIDDKDAADMPKAEQD